MLRVLLTAHVDPYAFGIPQDSRGLHMGTTIVSGTYTLAARRGRLDSQSGRTSVFSSACLDLCSRKSLNRRWMIFPTCSDRSFRSRDDRTRHAVTVYLALLMVKNNGRKSLSSVPMFSVVLFPDVVCRERRR